MSEMVERVAIALQAFCEGPPGDLERPRPAEPYRECARAAVSAMREPTPDMRIAGGIAWVAAMPDAETYVDSADAGWRAMITAALKE